MFLGKNVVTVPLQPNAPAEFELQVKLQGCADAGVCYPPYTHKLKVGGTPTPAASWANGCRRPPRRKVPGRQQ